MAFNRSWPGDPLNIRGSFPKSPQYALGHLNRPYGDLGSMADREISRLEAKHREFKDVFGRQIDLRAQRRNRQQYKYEGSRSRQGAWHPDDRTSARHDRSRILRALEAHRRVIGTRIDDAGKERYVAGNQAGKRPGSFAPRTTKESVSRYENTIYSRSIRLNEILTSRQTGRLRVAQQERYSKLISDLAGGQRIMSNEPLQSIEFGHTTPPGSPDPAEIFDRAFRTGARLSTAPVVDVAREIARGTPVEEVIRSTFPENLDIYKKVKLELAGEAYRGVGSANLATEALERRGFVTKGLSNFLSQVEGTGKHSIEIRGAELLVTPLDSGLRANPVSIPLFSTSLKAGEIAGIKSGSGHEFMYKGGTIWSTVAEIAQVGESSAGGKAFPLLKAPQKFSENLYQRLVQHVEDATGLGNLKSGINEILDIKTSHFDPLGGWTKTAQDGLNRIDPLSYSGDLKLGRHHLGFSNQIILEIEQGTKLHELITEAKDIRGKFSSSGVAKQQHRSSLSKLSQELDTAHSAVMSHLKTIAAKDPNSKEAQLAKRLHFAQASQSAEWIYENLKNSSASDGKNIQIKMMSSDIKNLSMLPHQQLYDKGVQFHLSRAPIALSNVREVPAAVSAIMGLNPEVNKGASVIPALQKNINELGGRERSVALGRRTIGVTFADARLTTAIFGDSSAMMSRDIVESLDINPITGRTRNVVTHNIDLKAVASAGEAGAAFEGVLRSDLFAVLKAHQHKLRAGHSVQFDKSFAIPLIAHEEYMQGKAVQYTEGALSFSPSGGVAVGDHILQPSEIAKADMRHTNDMLNVVQQRGLNPELTRIVGARLKAGTNQLELQMSEHGVVKASGGYITGGHRFAAAGFFEEENVNAIIKELGFTGQEAKNLRGVGMLVGEIGLSQEAGKGLFKTGKLNEALLGNLAQVISDKGDLAAAKALAAMAGGTASLISIPEGAYRASPESKIQIAGFGSKMGHADDFAGQFRALGRDSAVRGALGVESTQEFIDKMVGMTVREVDIEKILEQLPHYKDLVGAKKKAIDEIISSDSESIRVVLKTLGLSDVQAKQQAPPTAQKALMIVSQGQEIGYRAEDPMKKFGAKAAKIRHREASFIREAIEFGRGHGLTGDQVLTAQSRVFQDIIDSNPELLKHNNELNLILQSMDDSVLTPSKVLTDIREQFKNKAVGQLAVLSKESQEARFAHGLDTSTSIATLREQAGRQQGKLSREQIKGSLLGLVSDSGGAVISDQMVMVQGPHGPMFIPSAKAMGFQIEQSGGFRIPGRGGDWQDIAAKAAEEFKGGSVATKEAQSLYLSILEDVERLHDAQRTSSAEMITNTMADKTNALYQIMSQNSLSKQGLFAQAQLSPKKIAAAASLSLNTSPLVGEFEVGLTKGAIEKMHVSGKFGGPESKIGDILKQVRDGNFHTFQYREPIQGGVQLISSRVKLITDEQAGAVAKQGTKIDIDATAFLHKSTVQYAHQGDFDKDTINLFRLASMDDTDMGAIRRGQMDHMQGILRGLQESEGSLAKEFLGGSDSITDVHAFIGELQSGTIGGGERQSPRDMSYDALNKIAKPKHATPILDAHAQGRSYIDNLMTQIVEVGAHREGGEILKQNLIARVGREQGVKLNELLGFAGKIFGSEGTRRLVTSDYNESRTLIHYMFLKKAEGTTQAGREAGMQIADELISHGNRVKSLDDEQVAQMMRTLTSVGDASHQETQDTIARMADDLLQISGALDPDANAIPGAYQDLEKMAPKAFHQMQGWGNLESEVRTARAHEMVSRMLGVGVYTETIMAGDGAASHTLGGMKKVARGFINDEVITAHGAAAVGQTDFQAMAGLPAEVSEIHAQNASDLIDRLRVDNARLGVVGAQDAVDNLVDPGRSHSGGVPHVPDSSASNALRSGEFLSKISQTKYFKPAAAIVGGLAGIEAIRSAIDKFTPGVVPSMGYSSANTMPPPPMLSSPQDPTFAPDAMPNTNIARVSKPRGMRTSVNISGKMDNPVDFRGITNQHFLNNGYIPNIQGSFRSELNDTMSRGEISQHIGGQLNSAF